MTDLMKNPPMWAAVITGVITILGLIIQCVTFFVKHKYESKNNFEEVLKEKMGKIYTPLLIEFYKMPETGYFLSECAKELISKYGYLLSDSLLTNILELEKIEEKHEEKINDEASKIEYENLKDKIFLKLRKDFDELQDIYNNNFTVRKNKFFKSWYIKIEWTMIKFCVFLTSLFYFRLAISFLFRWLSKPLSDGTNNKTLDVLISAWILIVIITSIIGVLFILRCGINKLINVIGRFKKYYYNKEYVEKTANYYCRVCKKEYKLYKYSRFSSCEEHSFKQDIIGLFKLYPWALCDDKYYRIIKKKKIKKENKEKENDQQIETHCDTSQIEKSN
ncbi:hypothetical protein [Maledivibacter halophilus]|uniref:Uncharacterized protein n=1 Tax=Maledivibacter halophilus TaxID=36842 RepID=A0A1T5MFI6_9FIRM|nr:hypothetical protein [Maledivibacter halophilus]SKC87016.1 hypothetical protein SAMN02194393_04618 [Maledivibacter halophilus]